MSRQRTAARCILAIVPIALLASATVWGQSEAASGTIRGTISDATGAVVPGAKVTVKNAATGYTREIESGADGFYNIPLLPVGTYEVRVEKRGFATLLQSNVGVGVGQLVEINATLKVGAATEVVEVREAAPLIETTRTQASAVVDETAVRELPVHGRNYLDFVLLTPGVVRDNNRAGDINFGGLKGTYNSLQIDGADNNNNFFGQSLGRTGVRAPSQFSQEAVAEFQVKTNSYAAEYGRAGGAVINVVTKGGTNDIHGAAFGYVRDNALNANKWEFNRFGRAKPDLRVWQFGGLASGPIIKDKAFWLFNYDAQRRNEPNLVCFALPAPCAALRADSFLGPKVQDYSKTLDQDVYLGKADWHVSSNHNLSVRYNYQRFTGANQENSGDTSVREHTGDSLVRTHTLAGSLVSTFGPRWLNEFRGQWGRDSEPGKANATDPEIQMRSGGSLVLQFGRNNFSPRETTINRGQVVDNVSYLRGRNAFKFGVDINLERMLNFFPGLFGGRYVFNCLADFQDDKIPNGSSGCTAGSYSQNFAGTGTTGPTTHPDITEYSWFVQDELRATSTLTLNFGIRYDILTNQKPSIVNPDPALATLGLNTGQMHTDSNNIQPRLGFAWAPRLGTHPFVVRGGYGIYYARTPSILIATATSNNGLQVIAITVAGNLLPSGFAYPSTFSTPPTGATPAKPSLYTFQPDYVSPQVQQGSFGVEYQLAKDWSVSATYLLVKGTHLTRSNDVNLGTPTPTTIPISTGGSLTVLKYGPRPASNFGRVTVFQSNANSIYHGLGVTMNKRFSQHFQALASYTFSKAIDDKPDSTSVVPGNPGDDLKTAQDHFTLGNDRGLSDQDFRHRFVLGDFWELDYLNHHDNPLVRHVLGHWSFASLISAQNGRRWSVQTGGDANADGNSFTDRVPGFARNTIDLPRQVSVDMRLTHDFPVTERFKVLFQFDAFNLFNHPNFRDVNTNSGQGAIKYNLAVASASTATTNCPIGTTCFFPLASFSPANPNDLFVGTYDHPGGGSPFPGPGPRTLQLSLKLQW